ncbi:hypothetical protein AQI88_39535 [Streptomyces cellostaticus]|uniref:Uncharacterized protein n=1 Tax=Streptomyces cellostaticus TaxID=67285 RepID=A0A101NAW1_9ACTN|nr:DUF6415 family natural product biosynthesis protein [Streptomyces cellostaticus]KUM89754.1 hypothetical protein AQI88_39535 [Streptomyces cellostaticus]GHI10214.1 hypothetical protein Scel_85350 [Streptomyces cellostaticus]
MATTSTAPPAVGTGSDQLQADIVAALRSRTTLPPYDEVLRLIDTLKGHLAPLVDQAKEHHPGDGAWHQAIAGAEFQLRAGPGNGLVSATHRLQALALCLLHFQRHLHRHMAAGDR